MTPAEIRAWVSAAVTVVSLTTAGGGWLWTLSYRIDDINSDVVRLREQSKTQTSEWRKELRDIDRKLANLCAATPGTKCE